MKDKNVNKSDDAIIRHINGLIEDEIIKKILGDVYDRYNFHKKALMRSRAFYQIFTHTSVIGVPLLSALLTVIINHQAFNFILFKGASNREIKLDVVVGVLLTLITLLTSIFRPSDNYFFCCNNLIKLEEWKIDFFIYLSNCYLSSKFKFNWSNSDENSNYINFLEFLERKNSDLSDIGTSILHNLIPKPQEKRATRGKEKIRAKSDNNE